MSKSRLAGTLVLVVIMLAMAGPALAAPILELHSMTGASSSQAVVKNSDGDVLAETPWGGALPSAYASDEEDEEEVEIPILLLGLLRDQLSNSAQPEADEARSFVRDLMGTHAATPVTELGPSIGTWVSHAVVSLDAWCGTSINTFGECNSPGNVSMQDALCSQFTCKRTTMRPGQ